MSELEKSMQVLWHEIQTSEGSEAWEKVKQFTDNLNNNIEKELKSLDRGIVATPDTREHLENFAKANNGSMDIILMQMAMNYGYKLALENLKQLIS